METNQQFASIHHLLMWADSVTKVNGPSRAAEMLASDLQMQSVVELLLKSSCLSNQRLLTICSSLHSTRSLKQSVIAYKPRTLNSPWLLNARKHQAGRVVGLLATGHPGQEASGQSYARASLLLCLLISLRG